MILVRRLSSLRRCRQNSLEIFVPNHPDCQKRQVRHQVGTGRPGHGCNRSGMEMRSFSSVIVGLYFGGPRHGADIGCKRTCRWNTLKIYVVFNLFDRLAVEQSHRVSSANSVWLMKYTSWPIFCPVSMPSRFSSRRYRAGLPRAHAGTLQKGNLAVGLAEDLLDQVLAVQARRLALHPFAHRRNERRASARPLE